MDSAERVSTGLRSVDFSYPVCVHFVNKTERYVNVIWIDYEGQWIRYQTLAPEDLFEADTYVSHPWVFMDDKTKCRLIAVGKGDVFCPFVSDLLQDEEERHLLPLKISISIPMLSLRERCLEVLCQLAVDKNVFTHLNLCKRMIQQLQEFYDVPLEYNHILDLSSVVATCEEPPQTSDTIMQ
uniref:von Hippel-Lindau disease tumour suppressor beta domain-containing protein n=1 Tax=Strigamia maritima TaxID=126957 RepID=T1IT17_STRMM